MRIRADLIRKIDPQTSSPMLPYTFTNIIHLLQQKLYNKFQAKGMDIILITLYYD